MNRQHSIGASDLDDVFGLDYGCKRRLWYEKTGHEPDYPFRGNVHTWRGKLLESVGAELFEERAVCMLSDAHPLQHSEYPFITGTPDRIRYTNTKQEPVEIKCPGLRAWNKIQYEGMPYSYLLQLQQYIHLLNAEAGYFAILCIEKEDGFLPFEVKRNDELIEVIIAAQVAFWEQVQQRIIPEELSDDDPRCPRCSYRATCKDAKLLDAMPEVGKIELRLDIAQPVDEYVAARDLAREADAYLEQTKEALKKALGSTQVAEVDGRRIYYKESTSYWWDVKKLAKERQELVQDYMKKSVSRSLRVYEF